jgi:hypothetical protein
VAYNAFPPDASKHLQEFRDALAMQKQQSGEVSRASGCYLGD